MTMRNVDKDLKSYRVNVIAQRASLFQTQKEPLSYPCPNIANADRAIMADHFLARANAAALQRARHRLGDLLHCFSREKGAKAFQT